MPSPRGEGQTDTPINQANQGEVQRTRRSIVTIGVRSQKTEKGRIREIIRLRKSVPACFAASTCNKEHRIEKRI